MDHDRDEEVLSDHGDERAEEEDAVEVAMLRAARRERIPLHMHQFLRMLAGGRGLMADMRPATTNDELVNELKKLGVLKTDGVIDALRICARDAFVPENYRGEAFLDSPIRLEEYEFNISAPHMHATCLEALDVQPGNRVLDVGCGCGVLTAAMAVLAGPCGLAVGIDTRSKAVEMSHINVVELSRNSARFAASASSVWFEKHNAFMPSHNHKGLYDRVHVGASCPPEKLHCLVDLLGPQGGVIVVPVHPHDLRCVMKLPDGTIRQRILSQVRYGELEVPSDYAVLSASLELQRSARISPNVPSSTFEIDVHAIVDPQGPPQTPSLGTYSESKRPSFGASPSSTTSCCSFRGSYGTPAGVSSSSFGQRNGFLPLTSMSSICSFEPETPQGESSKPGTWDKMTRLFSSCSRGSTREMSRSESLDSSSCSGGTEGWAAEVRSAFMDGVMDGCHVVATDLLGEPDVLLLGHGWQMVAHRNVLRVRCDQFRARCDSGMRDAVTDVLQCPDHFSANAMALFLKYLYRDELHTSAHTAIEVLHIASYYGVPRLCALCELLLANELLESDADDTATCRSACALLTLADEFGLAHLRAVALDFMVLNLQQVAVTDTYEKLSHAQMHMLVQAASSSYITAKQTLEAMQQQRVLPEPSDQ